MTLPPSTTKGAVQRALRAERAAATACSAVGSGVSGRASGGTGALPARDRVGGLTRIAIYTGGAEPPVADVVKLQTSGAAMAFPEMSVTPWTVAV
jgi:hypothetical protein